MDDAFIVDVSKPSQQLVRVKLHKDVGGRLIELLEVADNTICSERDEVHHDVQRTVLWPLSGSEEGMLHPDGIRMFHLFENCQFASFVQLFSLLLLLNGYNSRRLVSLLGKCRHPNGSKGARCNFLLFDKVPSCVSVRIIHWILI